MSETPNIGYIKGNTLLLESLMYMVDQFFYTKEGDNTLSHSYMSAEEQAIKILINAGFAEELGKNSYRLLWDKLNLRKKDLGF